MSSFFESVLDQPDITPGLQDLELEAVTYNATARRTGNAWTVTVPDLPEARTVQVQAGSWREAESLAHDSVIELLGVEPSTVIVSVRPEDSEAAAAVQALTDARIARAEAEQAERDAARHAARLLTDKGWTARDAGAVLRYSHQRISQLAPRTAR